MDSSSKFQVLLSGIGNPLPAILDRVRLLRSPYHLEHKDGYRFELPAHGRSFGFFEIILRSDYTSSGQQIPKGATVIDVGAIIGCFTVLASQAVGSSGHVIASNLIKRRTGSCSGTSNSTGYRM